MATTMKKHMLAAVATTLLFMAQSAWALSSSDVGKVLGSDGKMYKTVAAATNAGTTASGVIAYVGSASTVILVSPAKPGGGFFKVGRK